MAIWTDLECRSARCDSSQCVEQADLPFGLTFRKATKSDTASNCVEVGSTQRLSAIRDSKSPELGALVTTRAAFDALLADCKAGRLDL